MRVQKAVKGLTAALDVAEEGGWTLTLTLIYVTGESETFTRHLVRPTFRLDLPDTAPDSAKGDVLN